MKNTKQRVRLSFLIILALVAFVEAVIMLVFHVAIDEEGNLWLEVFADSILLALILYPSLYYFMLRPMQREISFREQVEQELQAANDAAELRVVQRTAELEAANVKLGSEVLERQQAEEKLQEANGKLQSTVAELERRNQDAKWLTEMSDLLQACTSIQEAYRTIQHIGPRLFPESEGALYMYSPSRDDLETTLMWGNWPGNPSARIFEPDRCWALRRGRPHAADGLCEGLPCHNEHHLQSGWCVPMIAQGESLGVLYLRDHKASQPQSNSQLAVTAAEQIAMALANLRLRETLRNQSIRDPLTGVYNRRFMEESLLREIRRAERNQRELSLLIFDLDHFKQFNDTFGHEAGDSLLRELGITLKASIRGGDVACRYGGEEFVLILPETDSQSACQRAEELREKTRQLTVIHRGQALGVVTMSVGVAVYPKNADTADGLLRAADSALYRAKSEGRDRVICAI